MPFSLELEFCATDELVILKLTDELTAVGVMAEGLGTICVRLVSFSGREQLRP